MRLKNRSAGNNLEKGISKDAGMKFFFHQIFLIRIGTELIIIIIIIIIMNA